MPQQPAPAAHVLSSEEMERRAKEERERIIAAAWTAHKSPAGQVYYFNTETNSSSWEKPAGFNADVSTVKAEVKPVASKQVAGTDWSEVTTDDGKRYFYNLKTKETSWSVPPEVTLARSKDPKNPATVVAMSDAAKAILERLKANNADAHLRPDLADDNVFYSEDDIGGEQAHSVAAPFMRQPPPSGIPGPRPPSGDPPPSKDDCEAQFMNLLREKGVTPFSRWEKELPKLVVEARFSAIPSQKERRLLFDKFCKIRAEELRDEKRQNTKAAGQGFRQLLQQIVQKLQQAARDDQEEGEAEGEGGQVHIPATTTLASLGKVFGKDSRWKGCPEAERYKLYMEIVQPLVAEAEAHTKSMEAAASESFRSLMREAGISARTTLSEMMGQVHRDPRYRAVPAHKREPLFKALQEEVAGTEGQRIKESSAREERQEEARRRTEKRTEEADRRRQRAALASAVEAYKTLLIELVKDPEAKWTDWVARLENDPQGRATNPAMERGTTQTLFNDHTRNLAASGESGYNDLLAEKLGALLEAVPKDEDEAREAGLPPAVDSFDAARELLEDDIRFTRAPRSRRESWWRSFVGRSLPWMREMPPPPPPPAAPEPGVERRREAREGHHLHRRHDRERGNRRDERLGRAGEGRGEDSAARWPHDEGHRGGRPQDTDGVRLERRQRAELEGRRRDREEGERPRRRPRGSSEESGEREEPEAGEVEASDDDHHDSRRGGDRHDRRPHRSRDRDDDDDERRHRRRRDESQERRNSDRRRCRRSASRERGENRKKYRR